MFVKKYDVCNRDAIPVRDVISGGGTAVVGVLLQESVLEDALLVVVEDKKLSVQSQE